MVKSSLLWVLYLISIEIIFHKKKATKCHQFKSSEVSWLRTLPIVLPDTSVLIRIWRSGSKKWRIRALTNAYLNLVNASLTLGIRKSNPTVFLDLDKFLDLNNFWTFFSNSLSPTLLLSTSPSLILLLSSSFLSRLALLLLPTLTPPLLGYILDSVLSKVFNIEVSGTAIWLNS